MPSIRRAIDMSLASLANFAGLLALVLTTLSAPAAAQPTEVDRCWSTTGRPPEELRPLFDPTPLNGALEDGWLLSGLALEPTGFRLILSRRAGTAEVRFTRREAGGEPASASFAQERRGDPEAGPALDTLVANLAANDPGDWEWIPCGDDVEGEQAQDREPYTIPPGNEQFFVDLVGPMDPEFENQGYRFANIAIDRDIVVYHLRHNRSAVGELELDHVSRAKPGDLESVSFAIRSRPDERDPNAATILEAAAEHIIANDTGTTYETNTQLEVVGVPIAPPTWLILLIIPLFLRRGKTAFVRPVFRLTHLLPAALQVIILLYWALYIPSVRQFAPEIGLQLLFAVAFDALMSWRRYGKWSLSSSILPLVLSTNLFVQFRGADFFTQQLIIAVALLSKELIRRNGRHVMNPSAFGITVIGTLSVFLPALGYGDIAGEFSAPPNMTEVILLLALVVQVRIPVVLITVSSYFGLLIWDFFGLGFGPLWAPAFLVLALLITDPATSPRTNIGRILYGFFAGFMMGVFAELFTIAGYTDFYGKVIPVPIANALAPTFDRIGVRTEKLLQRINVAAVLDPKWNRLHVIAWFLFATFTYAADGRKDAMFDPALHAFQGTPIMILPPGEVPTCDNNPVFCDAFSFFDEAALWLDYADDQQVDVPEQSTDPQPNEPPAQPADEP